MTTEFRPRRRRRSKSELIVIYWRDLPAQVTASADGAKGSWLLEPRFQAAIDRAATVAGLTTTDDYVREWRRVPEPLTGEPQQAAEARAAQLQQDYPPERVQVLAENGGLQPIDQTPTFKSKAPS